MVGKPHLTPLSWNRTSSRPNRNSGTARLERGRDFALRWLIAEGWRHNAALVAELIAFSKDK